MLLNAAARLTARFEAEACALLVQFTNCSRFRLKFQCMQHRRIQVTPFLILALLPASTAGAQTYYSRPATPPLVVVSQPPQMRSALGGGFIEFLFGGDQRSGSAGRYAPPQQSYVEPPTQRERYANVNPADPALELDRPDLPQMDPQFLPQEVAYDAKEPAGTIVIDTPHHFLYL